MSPHNLSPLTDDRASFEHGKAAGQHAAQQLGANSPLSTRQLAWLHGFLDGLLSGSSLVGSPAEALRFSEAEAPARMDVSRSDASRMDASRSGDGLGSSDGQRPEMNSDAFAWTDALRKDANLRAEPSPHGDSTRLDAGMRFDSGLSSLRSDASVRPDAGIRSESGVRSDIGPRSEAARFESALRVVAQPFAAQAADPPALFTSNDVNMLANSPDLAAHVRATLATTSKRHTNVADEGRSKYTAENPFAARIVQIIANQARNPSAWRLTLDVESSGLRCRPGDLLGVVPSNDPDLVRRLLRRLGAKGQETVTTARGTGPAWRALLEEFSITQVTKELLWVLASSTRNGSEARQLETLANGGAQGPDAALATILRRFPGARPSLNDFVNSLRPLVPQYYPLASARSRQADTLEILAAKHSNETRSVVHQLHQEKLAQGDWLPVFVDPKPHVHPPTEIASPVIVLAPGVGAACAFAFLAERAATRGSGRNWLFTSPIEGETEVAYAEHFAAWQTSRIIGRLDVSPTQQLGNRLIDHGEMVQAWVVDGSYMYIYGTKSDCQELEQALAQLLVMRARISQEEAHKRLDAMRTSGQLRVNAVS